MGIGDGDWGLGIGDLAQCPNPKTPNPNTKTPNKRILFLKKKNKNIYLYNNFLY